MHLTITRPTNGPITPRGRVRMVNRHGTSLQTRPLLCQVNGCQVWVDPAAMPFPDATFSSIASFDLLAYVHDDQATIEELARISQPRGRLLLRVPNEGGVSGFDAFNLSRYLADGTHRGSRPPETDELGWRRHFRKEEIASLLKEAGLRVIETQTSGTGLTELIQLSAIIGFRWIRKSEDRYQRAATVIDRIRQIDNRIPLGGFGFTRTVIAERM